MSNTITVLGRTIMSDVAVLAIDEFVKGSCTVGVEGLRQEFVNLKDYTPSCFQYNHCATNMSKNRYKDVVCLDSTRVVLTLNVPPESDYIHANWVKLWGVNRIFIATQDPLECTISDFWRMIYEEEVRTILMLSKTINSNSSKVKCAQYWPKQSGDRTKHGSLFISNTKVEKDDKFIKNTIEVLPENCSDPIKLQLIQLMDWPDYGIPQNGISILQMLKLIHPNYLQIKQDGPCVVHCSAGIEGTGTVISIETCVQRLWKGYRLNIPEVLKELRECRASSIQTEGQYILVYLTVLYYISAKLPKHREAVLKFHDAFKAASLL
ncbi:unnamed protein product [Acanthocheilonema viteae]|uniref:Tyrosine-protein phosphatase domain-containing protein n=1 Tax=Acanthocheilonema viteae TaxID=6277 RepID=A0A498SBD5_ACAVI|nr:unnamed protein product [Acanthocheilonema viteae]